MSINSNNHRLSFRLHEKFSHLTDRVKDKIRDKAVKHNVSLLVHHNLTSNGTNRNYTTDSLFGFRQQFRNIKDTFKNKTHYDEIKDKLKNKIDETFDLNDNRTYPKGFYDSLFSPETENDVYFETAIICLWVIALLCIIPTIIVIFLPTRKMKISTTSTNMIFFHVFLCEFFYLMYILLAMINVAKNFRLAPILCDIANYGSYILYIYSLFVSWFSK